MTSAASRAACGNAADHVGQLRRYRAGSEQFGCTPGDVHDHRRGPISGAVAVRRCGLGQCVDQEPRLGAVAGVDQLDDEAVEQLGEELSHRDPDGIDGRVPIAVHRQCDPFALRR